MWSNHLQGSSASRELYLIFKEIRSINNHIQAKEEEATVNADWKFAAMVNTLLFLWKFDAMVGTLFFCEMFASMVNTSYFLPLQAYGNC